MWEPCLRTVRVHQIRVRDKPVPTTAEEHARAPRLRIVPAHPARVRAYHVPTLVEIHVRGRCRRIAPARPVLARGRPAPTGAVVLAREARLRIVPVPASPAGMMCAQAAAAKCAWGAEGCCFLVSLNFSQTAALRPVFHCTPAEIIPRSPVIIIIVAMGHARQQPLI